MFDDVKKLVRDNHSRLFDILNDNNALVRLAVSTVAAYQLNCDKIYKEILDLEAIASVIMESHEDKISENLQKIEQKLTNIKAVIDSVK